MNQPAVRQLSFSFSFPSSTEPFDPPTTDPLPRSEEMILAAIIRQGKWAERQMDGKRLLPWESRELQRMTAQARVAHRALVQANVRLVHRFAARWTAAAQERGLAYEDLVQSAILGLCEAAWRFDPCRWNTRFGTFAEAWAHKAMRRAIHASLNVDIPYVDEYGGILSQAVLSCDPDHVVAERVAAAVRARGTARARRVAKWISPERIAAIRSVRRANCAASLESPSAEDSRPLTHVLHDCDSVDVEDAVIARDERRRLYRSIQDLPPHEREVIVAVLEGRSVSSVAKRRQVSRACAYRWYCSALERLRVSLCGDDLSCAT